MALTTPKEVLRTGGLQEVEAADLFRLESQAHLTRHVQTAIDRAQAWLSGRAPSYYTGSATGSANQDADFKAAEEYFTLHLLYWPLRVRKVLGSHFPLDSEDSDAYDALSEDALEMAERFVSSYVVLETSAESAFALPTLLASAAILPEEYQSVNQEYEDRIRAAEPNAVRPVFSR